MDRYEEMNQERFEDTGLELRKANKTKKEKSFLKKLVSAVALALVFGLVAGGTIRFLNPQLTGKPQQNLEETEKETEAETKPEVIKPVVDTSEVEGEYKITDIAKMILPATVAINCVTQQTTDSIWWGQQTKEYTSSGTGFIVGQNDTELLVVTNNHVVSGANQIVVSFIDEGEAPALIKGTDVNNDLAVIAVELSNITAETMKEIATVEMGDSEKVEVGEQVVAVGNALGYGQSVTVGYISALNRSVTIDGITSSLTQTDAAINPGNSGGALVNLQGQVIGINSAKYSDEQVEGIGYAIPINTAEPIIEKLMNKVTRVPVENSGYMGVSGQNITAQMQKAYGLPTLGVLVISVEEGSAAEKAGINRWDIISEFDENPITTMEKLKETLTYYEAGETVTMKIYTQEGQDYVEKEITITLGSWEEYEEETEETQPENGGAGLPYKDNK